MARPKKSPEDKKTERLTVYFSPAEAQRLVALSQAQALDKNKIVAKALDAYAKSLQDPPEALRRATYEEIMRQDNEQVTGYVCNRGHAFFIESTWPSPPVSCPSCGERNIKSTWNGIVRKGF